MLNFFDANRIVIHINNNSIRSSKADLLAIRSCYSVVSKNIEPYTIVAVNPIRVIRKRFDDELIELLERFKWWDKSIDEINSLIPILTCSDLKKVKEESMSETEGEMMPGGPMQEGENAEQFIEREIFPPDIG